MIKFVCIFALLHRIILNKITSMMLPSILNDNVHFKRYYFNIRK